MKTDDHAFSRVDLLICVFAVSLLFSIAASLLASGKSESQRAICSNNLRQIGRAFHVWANDHDDNLPWWTPTTPFSDGGTYQYPNAALVNNNFFHYSWISNQLGSPRILVCPADSPTKKIALDWGLGPSGFLNVAFRGNSLSYPVFFHAFARNPSSILSGDRNFRVDTVNIFCSSGATRCFGLGERDGSTFGTWTNAVHGSVGHLLFMDGSVHFTTPSEFKQAISSILDIGQIHGLPAF